MSDCSLFKSLGFLGSSGGDKSRIKVGNGLFGSMGLVEVNILIELLLYAAKSAIYLLYTGSYSCNSLLYFFFFLHFFHN